MKAELWHGAHNKFILLCSKKDFNIDRSLIIKLNKKFNADGLIKIVAKKQILMNFFNSDGTIDNCGNGLRVTASFCFQNKLCKNKGVIISLGLKFPFIVKKKKTTVLFKEISKKKNIWSVGKVLHKTIITKNFEKTKKEAKKIRDRLNCNVTIIKRLKKGIFAQTFEKGVEDFTAACGTGAIASFMATKENKIFMPGGLLEVKKSGNFVSLTGPVERIGEINEI